MAAWLIAVQSIDSDYHSVRVSRILLIIYEKMLTLSFDEYGNQKKIKIKINSRGLSEQQTRRREKEEDERQGEVKRKNISWQGCAVASVRHTKDFDYYYQLYSTLQVLHLCTFVTAMLPLREEIHASPLTVHHVTLNGISQGWNEKTRRRKNRNFMAKKQRGRSENVDSRGGWKFNVLSALSLCYENSALLYTECVFSL